jgi:hypothetical protein
MCFNVPICNSFIPPVAAIEPATPDDNTCVVLTGKPAKVESAIVHAATISDTQPWAYVILCFPIFSQIVLAILFHHIIVPIPKTHAITAITHRGTLCTVYACGKKTTKIAIIIPIPF